MTRDDLHTPAIRLRGVRQNNLKNFDLDIPLGQITVITGLSGSGKSSLAFDTLFAEGQRRYIETFSPYARQFFDRMDKPQVDSIEGIPPAIALEQRNSVRSTRSTVGTMTELTDYLKILWPRIAALHCRQCGKPVRPEPPALIWEVLLSTSKNAPSPSLTTENNAEPSPPRLAAPPREILVTFTLPLSEKLALADSLSLIAKQGYQKLLWDGHVLRLDEASQRISSAALAPTSITVVQDRVRIAAPHRNRFIEACEQAYHFGKGRLTLQALDTETGRVIPVRRFSAELHCATCDLDYPEATPALFSFNHPVGACPACKGFGRIITIDYHLTLPDRSKTIRQVCVRPWQTGVSAECQEDLLKFCRIRRVPIDVPFSDLSADHQRWVMLGDPDYGLDEKHQWPRAWYGIKGYFRWLESKAYKMHVRVLLSRYRAYQICPECHGRRLRPEALLYRLPANPRCKETRSGDGGGIDSSIAKIETAGLSLADFYSLPIKEALALVERLAQTFLHNDPVGLVVSETRSRLQYLAEVGLGYLTLDRPTRTLSGGETERVNLTTCLGTRLVNTLFVLDEPSVGLHPRDTAQLVKILNLLRDAGNTVVVVEHDASIMQAADQIVDLGPGQGEKGGAIQYCGPAGAIGDCADSLTGQYLSGRQRMPIPPRRPIERSVRKFLNEPLETAVNAPPGHETAPLLNEAPIPYQMPKGLREPETWLPEKARVDAAVPSLRVIAASCHNLNKLSVQIPLQRFVCLTGVSGSGKTTLVRSILLPSWQARGQGNRQPAKAADPREANESQEDSADLSDAASPYQIEGWEAVGQVVLVDQSSLGKTPRSNPVVYIGAFDAIRDLFAHTDLARQRGLSSSSFSFNSGAGQCERCRGAGFEKIEMQFLSDVFVRCPECNGRRYRQHILEIKLRGSAGPSDSKESAAAESRDWSIADLLEATVDEVLEFLRAWQQVPAGQRASRRLELLQEVGLGYLRLGQPINTLSGGETQRLKLVSHLAESIHAPAPRAKARKGQAKIARPAIRRSAPLAASVPEASRLSPSEQRDDASPDFPSPFTPTLFLFDEPTTGLHFEDVRILLKVFQRLVDAGHSLLIIEHNLDVIKSADWVLELGPDAGVEGGRLVTEGTPETIAASPSSPTGRFLREVLARDRTPPDFPSPSGVPRSLWPLVTTAAAPASDAALLRAADKTQDAIVIQGAREHNLKNLSLIIPRGKFVVITGVSGSGKSTLAFDLLFAEGQRRFLDSMNTYARQFVEQFARPDVDFIAGLPPTVSIEQRATRGGGKSTVATVTEVYHFLRLLYARLGSQYCPTCQLPVDAQTRDTLAASLRRELKKRGDLLLLAPVVRNRKGFHTDVAEWAFRHGHAELRADGKIYETQKPFRLDRFKEHDIEIVVGVLDRHRPSRRSRTGLRRAPQTPPAADVATAENARSPDALIDHALALGKGTLFALDNNGALTIHSTERACPKCARSFAPLDPKQFSYNSSQGWCPRCRGFGELFEIPDVERGANADAIEESWWRWQEGKREPCPECHGSRLRPESRAVRLHMPIHIFRQWRRPGPAPAPGAERRAADSGPTIDDFSDLAVEIAHQAFRRLAFKGRSAHIARDILPEIIERLKFLKEVGLGYLQLGRAVTTLSGGEAQRIRLAAQLGSNLSGVLYVLDEPTIGLHPHDNQHLLAALESLRARGNSLVVVEHDEETMRRADYVIDLGPGAGVHGGQVVAQGTLAELMRHPESITGQCLRLQATSPYPTRGLRRTVPAPPSLPATTKRISRNATASKIQSEVSWLTLRRAHENNLRDLTVAFPLERLIVVTGVSGSGKSTLIRECLLPAVQNSLLRKRPVRNAARKPAQSSEERNEGSTLSGHERLKSVYEVDQSPIGRTPRSTPATYVGFFDDIRALFAQTPDARLRGYSASRFSFNSAQGRCPECDGAGVIKLEMNFLPPAYIRCESCQGLRFNRETLEIQYAGRNIAQVLDLTVEEALGFFAAHRRILRPIQALEQTGLGYLRLGQTSPTLSGGEAQRVKLVTHLLTGLREQPELFDSHDPKRKRNLFILEEPTIGLHMSDVRRLVDVLQRLVDAGHTVIVIEHNLDLIAEADWVIDLGPAGGDEGGRVVVEGTPEDVAQNKTSRTGQFLRRILKKTSSRRQPPSRLELADKANVGAAK